MNLGRYILVGQSVVAEPDLGKWSAWLEIGDRVVKQTQVGPYFVATVFLGLDYNFSRTGPPIVFETMVFCDNESGLYQTRCATWIEAEAMHKAACDKYQKLHDEHLQDQ